MRLYQNYIDEIKGALSGNLNVYADGSRSIKKGLESVDGIYNKDEGITINVQPNQSLLPLMRAVGKTEIKNQKLGEHPDFAHLKNTNRIEYHYITSVFIDIKNSTGLFRKYPVTVIKNITNVIQRAAIHTCAILGGYIHRLQGDGVFVYFGGKDVDKKQAVLNALTATSFFTYFVKNDLKKLFEEEGIEDIHTRIGIDFGDDQKVLWAVAGIGVCSEITTYSLHTSLASKMQAIANANSIAVGENVKTISQLSDNLYDWVKDYNGDIKKRYIFQDPAKSFYYKVLDFNWYSFLKSLPYISQDEDGNLFYESESDRRNKLRQTASLITSGNAFTNQHGNISEVSDGVKNQNHRFHYEE
ncbi:adenylate/guanylate cyclase domain-containing protein [uncultured Draconibacterium sp.]|uniref:adenylate/guanylate cyclase domain-containing protein n=1 Tax=uncultured Draconibacterium sp. TaxID=1573823 RepID=UPI0025E6F405|nr:adenylate/guanylate cyclase domain-containing protein [uncultured Draconibacterium sp.]